MMKCKSCGEINAEHSKFCSFCGKPFALDASVAIKDALENAEKNFEKDSLVSLDRSKITYICTVCGTVNSIDRDRCSKCGKPRPRNEFVSALKKIRQGKEFREDCKQSENDTQEEELCVAPLEKAEEIVVQQPRQQNQGGEIPYVYGGGQNNPIVQPFVVVPYVNQNQPIWQTGRNQLFRYEPYSQEEIQEMENQKNVQSKALAEVAELLELGPPVSELEIDLIAKRKRKSVRIVAALLMLLSLASIALFWFVNFFQSNELIYYVVGLGNCINAVTSSSSLFESVGYNYTGWADFIAPVAFLVFIILALVIVTRSFTRMLRGLAPRKGVLLPIILLLTYLVGVFGLFYRSYPLEMSALTDFLGDVDIGLYIILGISVLMTIVSFFSPANCTKRKVKK